MLYEEEDDEDKPAELDVLQQDLEANSKILWSFTR